MDLAQQQGFERKISDHLQCCVCTKEFAVILLTCCKTCAQGLQQARSGCSEAVQVLHLPEEALRNGNQRAPRHEGLSVWRFPGPTKLSHEKKSLNVCLVFAWFAQLLIELPCRVQFVSMPSSFHVERFGNAEVDEDVHDVVCVCTVTGWNIARASGEEMVDIDVSAPS
eukprot:487740-Amphidinium_carterae.1